LPDGTSEIFFAEALDNRRDKQATDLLVGQITTISVI
jgi:hypothetical protein